MMINSNTPLFFYNKESGIRHPLQERIITIGSAPECSIRLGTQFPAHAGHCLFTGGFYYFQSLTEEVPILINDIKINRKYKLKKGDKVQIGSVTLLLSDNFNDNPATITKDSTDAIGELIEMVLLLLRNREHDSTTKLMTAVSRLLRCDAARIVSEDQENNTRSTLVRYPTNVGLDRFSNRAIDWARDASKTVLMLGPDWVDSSSSNKSLEKNAVSSILCAPLRNGDQFKGYLYLDRISKSEIFNENDRVFCDRLLPLFNELLANSELHQRQADIIAALQKAQENDNGGIIHRSEKMHTVLSLAERIAPIDSPVLILGETGTGKELMACHIHSNSLRKSKPFKAINCGAIPENLIESELFGHEKGAFTGAHTRKIGLFESADGGTVFLDELGEMPLSLQTKLLRVLQESEIVRVGGTDTIKINNRIIAATNRDLKSDVTNGKFRQDLFFRLNVLTLSIPPLRERSEDILLLSGYFINKYCNRMGLSQKTLTNEAQQLLVSHLWPGNVRELENMIQKAVVMALTNKIEKNDIDISYSDEHQTSNNVERIPTLHSARETAEKKAIRSALQATMGNVSQTSRVLEIDRKWLFTKMIEFGIDAEEYRKSNQAQSE
jgi:transcriptional regulator with GAF, ATPase, and Fis domain